MSAETFHPDTEGLDAVLAALPEMVLIADAEGHIRYLNRAESGYGREQFLGVHAEDLLPGESKGLFRSALTALRETGVSQEYVVNVVLRDGFDGWYRTRLSVFGEADPIRHVLIMATNITELKRQEHEVEQLRELLPICSWCDRIRTEGGHWEAIEAYIRRVGGAEVSHALCDDCFEKKMAQLDGVAGR
jgi:PAS domain S-box-containing protein